MINISKVFQKCLEAQIITHYLHLKTPSYARHNALGAFYEELQGLSDSLAEKIMTDSDKKDQLEIPRAILLPTDKDEVTYMRNFEAYIAAQIMMANDDLAIQDILLDIQNLARQTLYMFTLN